ncbi:MULTISPECIES: DUF1493 family protein [Pantoea]|jgi:hypothetical protein|uniref:DUF1493 family protein n=1 Tax=Pantoea piersonii TaxID=2364647 RepID=A0AAJ5QL75_9GAMM|nr:MULTISPECIES: DUF1493 family protein [Pantoea]MDU6432636.1 DUF1493 family protein [Pantoea sp.]MBZ6385062.1 DUF1493 family protein [Pantoea piersonii]MBZ6402147.1 DUF1493 family protein [Pantoea piersonii]MBZ6409409.1 DUF1493 family protein [Pantoea piersonii]MBZ6428678.1 DUF1493 family protein [Pantoea piersonii]
MVDDIEQRIYHLVRRYNGVYLFNNEKKQRKLNPKTDLDTDMQLDVSEAEDLMDEFFTTFNIDKGNFKIETYYPDVPVSWNPFKKVPPIPVPDFTIGMLIESAKAGRWLYD